MTRTCFISVFTLLLAAQSASGPDYAVKPKDTLSRIAGAELGDAGRWREIAELNGLRPPYKISVGQTLKLPDAAQPPELTSPGKATPGPPKDDGLRTNHREWIWILVLVAALWLFSVIALRVSCWFSLVETSLLRCALLCLALAVLLVLCVGAALLLALGVLRQAWNPLMILISGGLSALLYLVGSVVVTRRILLCKWRSVLTVFVMTHLLVAAFMVVWGLLFGVRSTEAIRESFSKVMDCF